MQHTFAEWYEPDDPTLRLVLETGTVALDSNVLLDLYRTGSDQRAQILGVFEQSDIRPRVWIPYQVGLEYQRNRLEVARQHQPQYEKVRVDVMTAIGPLDDEERAIINDVARTMEYKQLVEFLDAYRKLREHSDGFQLSFTERQRPQTAELDDEAEDPTHI